MKKNLFTISMLLIYAIIAGCSQKGVDEYATVSFIVGDVKKNNVEAQIGDLIKENDTIVTDNNSFCDIKIGESIIRIKAQSSVNISSLIKNNNTENTVLGLNTGKMLCKPKKLIKDENFMVKTPTAVAGVRGTQFAIETDKMQTTRIKVFKGEVKVAKRVKQFESSVEKVLEYAPSVQKEEKVVITAKQVNEAEKYVDTTLKKETAEEKVSDQVIEKVIQKTKDEVVVSKNAIEKFKAEDFAKDNQEIIRVEAKPKEDVSKLVHYIKQEKEKPIPEGRLLVTKYDIYFIKDGKIQWDGKVINEAVKENDKLYIASEDYVFCAQPDGPVLWKKNIKNDGKVIVKDNRVIIKSEGQEITLDSDTGKKL